MPGATAITFPVAGRSDRREFGLLLKDNGPTEAAI
jgi:hypothetical protein